MDSQQKSKPLGTVRIWGCGGAGINVARTFYRSPAQENFAELFACFVDTSRSNLSDFDYFEEDAFLIPEKDGAGKIRRNIHQAVENHLGEIINRFDPKEFNIVVFSASGGSGSVIGPLVLAELVKKGQQAIGIVIGSYESQLTARNTLNTLRSLDNLAREIIKRPICISFHNNHENTRKAAVDEAVHGQISEFSVLASRQHHGLDTSDIQSWLRFDTHTTIAPQLALIDIVDSAEQAREVQYPIAIASLLSGTSDVGQIGADYFCDGSITPSVVKTLNAEELHFIISVTMVPELVGIVNEALENITERNNARPKSQPLTASPPGTGSGLVMD